VDQRTNQVLEWEEAVRGREESVLPRAPSPAYVPRARTGREIVVIVVCSILGVLLLAAILLAIWFASSPVEIGV
jgi:hypothetical protein